METRRTVLLFAVAMAAAIMLVAPGCAQLGIAQSSGQGRAVFTMADAAADMGSVTSVKVTVDRLEAQHAASGWVTVSSSPYTYDLLQLRESGSQALIADTGLEAGAYGQVRMHISKVMIADATGEHEATLPSGDLKIVGGFEIKPNATTAVTFDFLADKSVHVTGSGKYILAPVVRMQRREGAEVDASSRGDVKVFGGRTKEDIEVGMDEKGDVGVGIGIPASASITVNGGAIVVKRLLENENEPAQACTLEAKICPDGSAVGRQGKDCEFAACPKENGLAACVAISEQQERLSCIAVWCGSESRDYNKCYGLANNDDKLGCLNKCNPNSNI